ncbi:nuclear pore complex protein DDB_G0274915-like, partial [Manduca sexta]|uniref:nuclear pore complex protein DDB_G0274915-like n=1 Tax=Manduca sexta TaxID=7130 RepID=UPI00188E81C3
NSPKDLNLVFGFQTVKPQFALNQPSQDSSILPSTASSFTQFGSQSGQQSVQGLDIQQNKPLEGVFSKPGTNNFGSLTSNLGQTGSSNVAEKEYSPSVSNDSPAQSVDYQKPQIGIDSTPAFVSGVKPVGFVSQSQGSSATASASVTGSQTSLSGLSPQVLGGLQGPSKSQQGQYSPQPSIPQFGSKPVGLSAILKPASAYPQNFGLIGDKKQPQPAGFLVGSDESSSGQNSQGEDHSYHYKQPAKPFNSPSSVSQGSSLSAGQISQTSNQFSSFNAQSSQKEQSSASSKPFGSASHTTNSDAYQPSHNAVTQAAVSPFPSPSPSPVPSFPQKVPAQQSFQQGSNNFLGQKPSTQKEQSLFGQTSSVAFVESQKAPISSQNAPSVPAQQYTGELYEYNKPQQGIPAPTPSSTPSSLGTFGQPSQGSFSQGSLSSSQFGTKPQFGQGSQSFQGSSFQQSTQQSSQGNKATNIYLPPISITSSLGILGSKPQVGQGSQSSQGSVQQSTQSSQSVTQQAQESHTQLGSEPSKPFGVASQIGSQNKPQVSQVFQASQGSFQQTNQQTVGSAQGQGSQSQFGIQSYKPFGSQFGTQGTKPQSISIPQKSQGSLFQSQTTSQTIGTQQSGQGTLSQFGSQSSKPFGSSQFGVQNSKPQFAQPQSTSQGSSLTQTQVSQQTVGSQQQSAFEAQNQFASQSNKPFGSQFGSQGAKPQLGQVSQTHGSSISQTQITQQTIGSAFDKQQQTKPDNVYLPSKPSTVTPQFGVQESKPQFGQVPSSQGSTFQQSTQSVQQTVGSLGLSGGQPSKPFGTTTQFGVKPQGSSFTQTQTAQHSESTQQQSGQDSQIFGSQPSKPFSSPQFGAQGVKPQGSAFGQSQTSQQTVSSVTQQQSGQDSQVFGSQPTKPFGSSQFGVQGVKPQGSSFTQTQTSHQIDSTVTQQQSGQGSQILGSQPTKPLGSSQFGVQGVKPQGSTFGQSQTSQQIDSIEIQQQSGLGSQVFGSQPSKPFGSTQFGVQGVKPQGSAFGQSQTSQQTVGSITLQQSGQGSQVFDSQPSKPFGSSQFSVQGAKPQDSSLTQTQTIQQVDGTVIQQQTGQGSQILGSKPSKPFGSSQFGIQGVKPQGSAFGQSQTSQQTVGSIAQQQSGQSSQIFGSQPSKPFGTSQFGVQGNKPQFGQVPQSSQGSSLTQTQTTHQTVGSVIGPQQQPGSQTQFGSQTYKPFGASQVAQGSKPQLGLTQTTQQSAFSQSQFSQQSSYNKFSQSKPFITSSPAPFGSVFGTNPTKTEYGSNAQKTESSSGSSVSQLGSQFGQSSSQGSSQFGAQAFKPFSTSHHQESKPQFGAPSKPAFGQSSTTYAPFTNNQNSQSQFGYQYKHPVNAFGKYQPKPLFGQTGFTGFSSSQASSSASSFPQDFKGTLFGSQPFRPFGSQIQPIKSQFGQPTSSASAFASSSSTPSLLSGSKFSLQPFKTSSSVFPTAQPAFGQSTTPLSQEDSGTQATSLSSVQGANFGVQKPFGSGISQASTPQPLGSKPDVDFGKPCCQANKFSQSTTAVPSFGVSSTPSTLSTPHDAQGSAHKTEDFKGPKQPQGFDEKTGYYY